MGSAAGSQRTFSSSHDDGGGESASPGPSEWLSGSRGVVTV